MLVFPNITFGFGREVGTALGDELWKNARQVLETMPVFYRGWGHLTGVLT